MKAAVTAGCEEEEEEEEEEEGGGGTITAPFDTEFLLSSEEEDCVGGWLPLSATTVSATIRSDGLSGTPFCSADDDDVP